MVDRYHRWCGHLRCEADRLEFESDAFEAAAHGLALGIAHWLCGLNGREFDYDIEERAVGARVSMRDQQNRKRREVLALGDGDTRPDVTRFDGSQLLGERVRPIPLGSASPARGRPTRPARIRASPSMISFAKTIVPLLSRPIRPQFIWSIALARSRWWGSSFRPSGMAISGLPGAQTRTSGLRDAASESEGFARQGSGANPVKQLDVPARWKQAFRSASPKSVSCRRARRTQWRRVRRLDRDASAESLH